MLDSFGEAFMLFLSWPNPLYLVLGTFVGMIFGILPGLGGPQVVALLIPVTYTMSAQSSIVLLIGAVGAIAFSGSMSAILINTPGTGQSAATALDGFALTRQGKAGMALGASATSSALGAFFGAMVLTAVLPVGRQVVLAFSYPEYFMLAILGLSVIAVISRESLWKGLLAALVGLMLSTVGYDPVTGSIRYTFGLDYLFDGIALVPVLIGLFAVGEAVELLLEKGAIAAKGSYDQSITGILSGVKAVFQNFGLFIRSSLIGVFIGLVPGVGGAVANFVAYVHAVQSAKDSSKFGKGDIRGVIAPEAANDAKDGGALIPTLLFGIPGSAEKAVLLGALILHGIPIGPRLMLDRPELPLTFVYALVFSNFLVAIFGLLLARPLTRLTTVPTVYVAPVILTVALVGAYATHGMFQDVVLALIFGAVGIAMKRFGFSRIALIIALLLGEMAQKTYFQTMMAKGPQAFVTRPISLFLLILLVVFLVGPFLKARRQRGASA